MPFLTEAAIGPAVGLGISDKMYRGVGCEVDPDMTLDEVLQAAGLDWEVKTCDTVKFGDEFQYETRRTRILYRENPANLNVPIHLGTTKTRWKPFQNKEVIGTFLEFCKEYNLKPERVGSLDHGRTVFGVADLGQTFSLPGKDIVDGRILMTNRHEVGQGQQFRLMPVRLVCTNQITYRRVMSNVLSHASGYVANKSYQVMQEVLFGFQKFEEEANKLANSTISIPEAYAFLIKLIGDPKKGLDEQPKAVNQIIELYKGSGIGSEMLSSYGTKWGLLNAITESTNWHSQVRGGVSTHVSSLWTGSKAALNKKAMSQLVSLS